MTYHVEYADPAKPVDTWVVYGGKRPVKFADIISAEHVVDELVAYDHSHDERPIYPLDLYSSWRVVDEDGVYYTLKGEVIK